MRLLRYSEFESQSSGHGGSRRTAQLDDLFYRHGIEVHHLQPLFSTNPTIRQVVGHLVSGALIAPSFDRTPLRSLRGLIYTGLYTSGLRREMSDRKKGCILIWEPSAKGGSLQVGKIAKVLGYSVVALPHNLESLVPSQRSPMTQRVSPWWFHEEVRYLNCADRVFCISREEQWLLRAYGVDADYLPYFPSADMTRHLLEIRNERRQIEKTLLLILGTAFNPATRLGMAKQIGLLLGGHIPQEMRIAVAGYGTEQLKPYLADSPIELLGTVDDDTLRNLLLQARALLAHQVPTSGILTRIVEMQLVGIPIIANVDAARSYYGASGVHVYETRDELMDLASANLPCPAVPERNPDYETRLVSAIKDISNVTIRPGSR